MKYFSTVLVTLFIVYSYAPTALGHGSMESPVSRIYNCFLENPENPVSESCREAVRVGGKQALYDWNGVNIANADDMHMDIIPDGRLCSAGNELFRGIDIARDDWRRTTVAPGPGGDMEFVFLATAPHSTDYFRFYITRNGYNPLNPLKWSDLEASPFCEIDSVTLENGRYRMSCPFPQDKSGEHLIYAVWQRDDSPEAFYTCMDVEFTGGGPVVWRSIGELRARQDLSPGDTVTFRLFGPSGGDAETYTLVLEERQAGASEWPFYLAQVVNGSSSLVRIGIPDSDGNINPVLSSQENIVYTASGEEYSFQVDIEMDDNGGGTEPCDCCAQCGNDCQGPMGTEAEYTYPEGIGSYEEGTVVLGTDGNLYECRPFPNSGWCNQSGLYYAPGTGIAWEDAWTLIQ